MRINVYAEEMTDRIEIIGKEIDGHTFTGLRFYLELPVTTMHGEQLRGPFIHRPGDDDSSAVTFWGKRDLREVLRKALAMLDGHYTTRPALKHTQAKPKWFAESLTRRAEVEQWLFDAAKGKRATPTAEECLALAMKLGVSNDLRDERFDATLDPARLAEFDAAVGTFPQKHPTT